MWRRASCRSAWWGKRSARSQWARAARVATKPVTTRSPSVAQNPYACQSLTARYAWSGKKTTNRRSPGMRTASALVALRLEPSFARAPRAVVAKVVQRRRVAADLARERGARRAGQVGRARDAALRVPGRAQERERRAQLAQRQPAVLAALAE